jgi:hypothetical protein
MFRAFQILVSLAFLGHSLTAPFRVLCHAPGPDGHERVEFVGATCCGNHDDQPACATTPGKPSCAADPACCGSCTDLPLDPLSVVLPSQDAGASLSRIALPVQGIRPPAVEVVVRDRQPPDHPRDPPLFLTHCNFRI